MELLTSNGLVYETDLCMDIAYRYKMFRKIVRSRWNVVKDADAAMLNVTSTSLPNSGKQKYEKPSCCRHMQLIISLLNGQWLAVLEPNVTSFHVASSELL